MNRRLLWSCVLVLMFFSKPSFGQSPNSPAGSANDAVTLVSDSDSAGTSDDSSAKKSSDSKPDPDKLRVVIYPVLGVAPVFGIDVNVPEPNIPGHPMSPGGGVAGSASSSFNGAAFFGFTVEKKWFYFEGTGMWTNITASRTNTNSFGTLGVSTDWWTGSAMAGVRFYHDFFATGGFHTLSLDYKIDFTGYPTFTRSPSLWDPLIGVMWKHYFSRKWELRGNVSGGGFGVGADEDIAARGQADWQLTRHFGATFGWELLHVELSHTLASKTFTASQTMNGPLFGFGVYF